MKEIVERLRRASEGLRGARDDEVIDGLARALALWRGRRGVAAQAAGEIAAVRGSSEAMIRCGLDRMVRAHDAPALQRWLRSARREAAARGSMSTFGPRVVAQILAGNVAGLALPAAVEALLARSAVLLKPAREERVAAVRFRETLLAESPLLAEAVAVEYWEGGDEAVETTVFEAVDMVVGSGGAGLVAAMERIRSPRLVYGPRISIGVVGSAWRQAKSVWWRRLGREIALWDQAGCLSPRILFVAGEPAEFAARVADSLADWEARWPARPRSAGEASAVHAYRARHEMTGGGVLASPGTEWTVVWDEDLSLEAGPPHRVLRVTRRPRSRDMAVLLESQPNLVQALGVSCLGPRSYDWRTLAARSGVPWVTTLIRLQDPPAGWRADGKSGLVELLVAGS